MDAGVGTELSCNWKVFPGDFFLLEWLGQHRPCNAPTSLLWGFPFSLYCASAILEHLRAFQGYSRPLEVIQLPQAMLFPPFLGL